MSELDAQAAIGQNLYMHTHAGIISDRDMKVVDMV